jgi:hypothetical protein
VELLVETQTLSTVTLVSAATLTAAGLVVAGLVRLRREPATGLRALTSGSAADGSAAPPVPLPR